MSSAAGGENISGCRQQLTGFDERQCFWLNVNHVASSKNRVCSLHFESPVSGLATVLKMGLKRVLKMVLKMMLKMMEMEVMEKIKTRSGSREEQIKANAQTESSEKINKNRMRRESMSRQFRPTEMIEMRLSAVRCRVHLTSEDAGKKRKWLKLKIKSYHISLDPSIEIRLDEIRKRFTEWLPQTKNIDAKMSKQRWTQTVWFIFLFLHFNVIKITATQTCH